MASSVNHFYSFFAFVIISSLLCSCSMAQPGGFSPTVATWFGNANGAGSNGGACGYGAGVEAAPYNKFVSAGGSSLFKGGQGCGACYQVKCTSNPACSGKPVTVTISDLCPGNCGAFQFDLSGTAFGAMALPGKADPLRGVGKLNIQYQRVPCNYPGFTITFTVDPGSNPFYFAANIEFEDGDGDLSKVEIQQANSNSFAPMQVSFGATWKFNSPTALNAPFSIQLTNGSGKSLVASNVIPVGWKPGETYRSNVNFS
ncbi:putative expansin-B14 [Actinidia eriantha]|uniref:putative expansin-B14 n=1 Tax=Actinidia eriantha TaxID=165200 RepID=UPI002585FC6A|nr:putative expansin-B14 [Actinidia eriantha]